MSLPVPLSVRLVTARADRHVTADLRDLTFRSTVPGGFATATMSFNRPLAIQPQEIGYYQKVYIYDGSAQTLWEGRLEDPGRTAGDNGEVYDITAIGPAGHTRDRTVPLVYADRQLNVWLTSSFSQPAVQVSMNNEQVASLQLQVPRGTVATVGFIGDVTYQEMTWAAMKLARISFTWDTGVTDANWFVRLLTRTGTGGSPGVITQAAFNTAGGSLSAVVGDPNFVNGHDVANLRIQRDTSSQTIANDDTWAVFRNIAMRGMLYDANGVEITSGYTLNTVYAHEIVADLLGRLLTQFDGPGAQIATNSYPIQQLTYADGVTAEKVLQDLMLIEADHYWAAWESNAAGRHRFEWRPWPTDVRFDVDLFDGADFPGSAEGLYNAVRVRWLDSTGRVRTTRRTQTVPELSAANLTREGFVDLGRDVASLADAERAGDQFLVEHAAAPNRGTITVARPVIDYVAGRMVSPWELPLLAPGSLVRARGVLPRVDALNASTRDGVTVFRCTGAVFNASTMSCRLELDAPPPTLAQMVGQLASTQARR